MGNIPIVKIKSNDKDQTECFVDGIKLNYVRSVAFNQSVDTLPEFTFETVSFPDIEIGGNVKFQFSAPTIAEAAAVIRHEYIVDPEFRKAFICSVESVLEEDAPGIRWYGLAETIADRIIGMPEQGEDGAEYDGQ